MPIIRPIIAGNGLAVPGPPSTARDDGIGAGIGSLGGAADNFVAVQAARRRDDLHREEFKTGQDYVQRLMGIDAGYKDLLRHALADGAGLTDSAEALFDKETRPLLDGMSDHLRPYYEEKLETDRARLMAQAGDAETARRDGFFVNTLSANLGDGLARVVADTGTLEAEIGLYHTNVLASALPPTVQNELMIVGEHDLTLTALRKDLASKPAAVRAELEAGGGRAAVLSEAESQDLLADAIAGVDQQRFAAAASAGATITKAAGAATDILHTGQFADTMPVEADFVTAFGPEIGPPAYAVFAQDVAVARNAFRLRATSTPELEAISRGERRAGGGGIQPVWSSTTGAAPVETGWGEAARLQMDLRRKAPFRASIAAEPGLDDDWANLGDPDGLRTALSHTWAVQQGLGIAEPAILPDAVVDRAVAHLGDQQVPSGARGDAVIGIVLSAEAGPMRLAVADQFRAALPALAGGGLRALLRGDPGGAAILFSAVPENAPADGFQGVTDLQIDNALVQSMFGSDPVGDVYYGVIDGAAKDADAVARDYTLLRRVVRQRMALGEPLNDAVATARRALFGNVMAVIEDNAAVLIPAGASKLEVRAGFTALLPRIEAAVDASLGTAGPPADGLAQEGAWQVAGGQFRNAGDDRFVFVDEFGRTVPGPDGTALTFTLDDVTTAGRTVIDEQVMRTQTQALMWPGFF